LAQARIKGRLCAHCSPAYARRPAAADDASRKIFVAPIPFELAPPAALFVTEGTNFNFKYSFQSLKPIDEGAISAIMVAFLHYGPE
jgi:hypothetical protein